MKCEQLITGSKTAHSGLKDELATTPAPPTNPAAKLSNILPYKLGMTRISNC